MRVMVIEDDPLTQAALCDILERLGHQPIAPKPEADVVKRSAQEQLPDLALVDINLGQNDGISIALDLKKRCKIPIVFVSSYHDGETIQRAAAIRPNGYIIKPFSESEIYAAVEIAVANYVEELEPDPLVRSRVIGRQTKLDSEIMVEVTRFLETRFAQNISTEAVARHFGLGRIQFSHLFKQAAGTTVHAHIVALRMAEAKRLLITTSWTMSEIAERVGYQKTRHFVKLFERETGQLPSVFRRREVMQRHG